MNPVMTVADLIATLQQMDPEATVRLAEQPNYPMEYSVGDMVEVPSTDDGPAIVYLVEGSQVGYLPRAARDEMGW